MNLFSKPIKGVIFFDIDDTLCDTSNFFKAAVIQSLQTLLEEKRDLNVSLNSLFDLYINIYNKDKNAQNHYNILLKTLGLKEVDLNNLENKLVSIRHEFKFNHYKDYKYHDAIELFEKLENSNFKVGIISDGIEEKQLEKLKLLYLLKKIDKGLIYITKSKNSFEKNIEGYKKIYEKTKLRYKTNNIWMIGDREDKDIYPAKEVGFKTIRSLKGKYSQSHPTSNAHIITKNLDNIPINYFFIFQEIENKLNLFKRKSNYKKIQEYSSKLLNLYQESKLNLFKELLEITITQISKYQQDSPEEIKSFIGNLQTIKQQLEIFNLN